MSGTYRRLSAGRAGELASSPAYQVAAALELAVAQRAAVWRDHPDYQDWADEDQATLGA